MMPETFKEFIDAKIVRINAIKYMTMQDLHKHEHVETTGNLQTLKDDAIQLLGNRGYRKAEDDLLIGENQQAKSHASAQAKVFLRKELHAAYETITKDVIMANFSFGDNDEKSVDGKTITCSDYIIKILKLSLDKKFQKEIEPRVKADSKTPSELSPKKKEHGYTLDWAYV